FILMHPQLVAGAWVGFNDNRVTMQDSWGQGARSALPMVGEFFQLALRAKVADATARFAAPALPVPPPPPEPEPENGWLNGLFQPGQPGPALPPPAEQMVSPEAAPAQTEPRAIIVQRPLPGGPAPERGVRILSIPAQGQGPAPVDGGVSP
ncbi:MAG: penicillin-binding protein, partial [Ramlibacter sp.]